MATQDYETLARALARIADTTADVVARINRTAADHGLKELQYSLRREAQALLAPYAPPAPPPPPPAPELPPRDRSMDPPSPSEVVFIATKDVSMRNLEVKAGEPYPELWQDKVRLCRLYGTNATWPPPWVKVEIRRAAIPRLA
jgi:hypothetical protein